MTWGNYKLGVTDEMCSAGMGMNTFPRPLQRYALKVSNKYDSRNLDWLTMSGNPYEWYILYHGTSCSAEEIGGIIKTM